MSRRKRSAPKVTAPPAPIKPTRPKVHVNITVNPDAVVSFARACEQLKAMDPDRLARMARGLSRNPYGNQRPTPVVVAEPEAPKRQRRFWDRPAWWLLKGYGEIVSRLRGNRAGYYWSLRAMCNWTGFDWYGKRTEPSFDRVGWIKF